MVTPPLVSVVIPCYRQARLLGEAIESALAQRHPRVEVIVVDDGSPDDAAAVTARYPGVRYHRQANQGLSGARNTGLRLCRGSYVAFLDADDRLLPEAIEAGLACFAACPACAFVYGGFRFMAEDGTPLAPRVRKPVGDDLYEALLRQNHVEMTATVLFRRDILDRAGGFLTSLRSSEDYELLLRLARTHPARSHDTLVAEYRRYAGFGRSLSNDPGRMLQCTMQVLRAQRPYVRGNARYEEALNAGIRFFQNYYGGELIEHVGAMAQQHAWSRTARSAAILLRYYPRGIVERVVHRARAKLRSVRG